MRVGIDGVSAAGKTTFADALEEVDPEGDRRPRRGHVVDSNR